MQTREMWGHHFMGRSSIFNARRECVTQIVGGTMGTFDPGWLESQRVLRHLYCVEWFPTAGAGVIWSTADCIVMMCQGHEVTVKALPHVMVSSVRLLFLQWNLEIQCLPIASMALALVQSQAVAVGKCAGLYLVKAASAGIAEWHDGLWGLSRSVRQEIRMPLCCVDMRRPNAWVRLVCSLVMRSDEPELLQRGDKPMYPRLINATKLSSGGSKDVGGAHMVTGGLGGLGLLTARWLTSQRATAVMLVSRSGSVACRGAFEWSLLEETSVKVHILRYDVADIGVGPHLSATVAGNSVPPMRGLWHAAGVLADAVLAKQSEDGLCQVYAPKVYGAQTLQAVSVAVGLCSCVLFSSVAALLGGAGQSNYSAANACLDAHATVRRECGVAGISTQWGAWADVGMAANEMVLIRMRASGFGLIGLVEGLVALRRALWLRGSAVFAMLPVRWGRMFSGMEAAPAFLSRLVPLVHAQRMPAAVAMRCTVGFETVLDFVRRTAGRVVDADAPLMEAGLDSLGAVELRNQLQGAVGEGLELPSSLIFEAPTARQIATYFEDIDSPVCARTPVAVMACTVDLDTVLQLARRTTGAAVDVDAPLMEAGLDSLGAVDLRNQLQGALGERMELPSSLIFEAPTVRHLAQYCACSSAMTIADAAVATSNRAPYAIKVTAACALLPGAVATANTYGHMSALGVNVTSEVPAARWDVDAVDANAVASGLGDTVRLRMRYGAFVRAVQLFDARAFAVSPAEANAMDPQQRLLLDRGYTALHVGHLFRASLLGSETGVYVGISSSDFAHVLATSPLGKSVYAATGSVSSIASGRLSYVLGLHGACSVIDTACSAGLVATSFARSALVLNESDVASVMAVSLILSPDGAHTPFAIAGMTSATGKCHTFDKHTDGYARSEACGASVLQISASEVKELVVLRGSAVRCDGKSASLTAPNGQAQRHVISAAFAVAQATPAMLSLVEAHGTGTALGDPMEVGSMAAVTLKHRSARVAPMAVGSMKANAGHSEPAAGFSGLLKLAIGLARGDAAPNAQLHALNPHLSSTLRGLSCALPAQLSGLKLQQQVGGVSSFGYSGTIAHAVLAFRSGGSEASDFGLCAAEAASEGIPASNAGRSVVVGPPLSLRRCAFPWCDVSSSVTVDTASARMYSICWRPVPPASAGSYRMCLWLTTKGAWRTGDPSALSPIWRAVAVLLQAGTSAAPSLHGMHLVLALTHQLARNTAPPPCVLMLISGALAFGITPSTMAHSGLWGFSRVLRLEHAALSTQSVGISSHGVGVSVHPSVTACLAEAESEMSWRGRQRAAAQLRMCSTISPTMLLACGMYAMTGGLGGLGLRTAKMLAESGASGIMLSSRSGRSGGLAVDDTRRVNLFMAACDVGDAAQAVSLLACATATGVLHAAGVLHDKMLRSMATDDVEAVFFPKALAASHIHVTVAGKNLEAMGVFSSIASTVGNVGQGNYAAANAYLDVLAFARNHHGVRASSLQIPAVRTTGMSASTLHQEQLNMMGAISLDQFATCMSKALVPARAVAECIQAPLADQLLQTLRMTSFLVEEQQPCTAPTPTCMEEAFLKQERSSLPRSTGKYVRLSLARCTALLELNDPAHFNTLSMQMASDAQAAVSWLAAQERGSIRSVALQGTGEHFCPGGNMYREGALATSLEAVARSSIDLFDGFCCLRTLPMPAVCAAHGTVLGGGLAICLLTDYVASNHAATFQLGERSRSIHPAGLLTRTLAVGVGMDVAMELYLTDAKLTSTHANERELIQAVSSSVSGARQLVSAMARSCARSVAAEVHGELQAGLWASLGVSQPSERRTLAADAFAQARSLQADVSNGASSVNQVADVVFTNSDGPLTRGSLRKAVQVVLSAGGLAAQNDRLEIRWTAVNYASTEILSPGSSDVLRQLLQRLHSAQDDQSAAIEPLEEESSVMVTQLAARFINALSGQPGTAHMDVLMSVYENDLPRGTAEHSTSSSGFMQHRPEPCSVDDDNSCLLLLRLPNEAVGNYPPLVIAHSLLGDHRGYGRLWNVSFQQYGVYALQHRGLIGAEAFALDNDGAADMVGEYTMALLAIFGIDAFDIIGASFGAILASHISCASRLAGGGPRRLILMDPPPAVPKELPLPKMITSIRTAAMGVLLLHLHIEMGASVWEKFAPLQTLDEDALACFVAAQCLPVDSSKEVLIEWAERFRRLLPLYRQCRHALHCLSINTPSFDRHSNGSPAILMVLSHERWPTFREMFPGIKEDNVDEYGPAAMLRLPGKHITMINRCLGNRDAAFTDAMERFLVGSFGDAWWWAENFAAPRKEASLTQQAASSTAMSESVGALLPFLSAARNTSTTGAVRRETSGLPAVEAALQKVAQELLSSHASIDTPLMEAGLDSLGAVEFRSRLSNRLGGVKLPETLVFDFPTLRQVEMYTLLAVGNQTSQVAPVNWLTQPRSAVDNEPQHRVRDLLLSIANTAAQKPTASLPSPIATQLTKHLGCIEAVSCKMGGGIPGTIASWRAAATAHNAVSSAPTTRWDTSDDIDIRALYGAFLLHIDLFDQTAFGLPPAEADVMDPHQRLALEEGYAALNAAGLIRSSLTGSVTGVYGGLWPSDYSTVLPKRGALGRGPFAVAATGPAMLVGRLSYTLGLHGPSIAFDTACSASLSALQAAMYAQNREECTAALVFGVNVMCDSNVSQLFAAAQMMSPTGKSHTFDARADGYARGESCCSAALMLEPEELRHVRCEAGTVRQDGKSASLTAPNGTAQQALIRAALSSAGLPPRGAFVLEAHGTGTGLGDPIEARAMCAVRQDPGLMSVMGCKANVGHTEPSAGIAGLLQLVLVLLRGMVCPNAQLRAMNPHVKAALEGSPSLPVQMKAIRALEADLVGGVSSFGLNGTITHVIVSTSACCVDSIRSRSICTPFRQRTFQWRYASHPFIQRLLPASHDVVIFRSSAVQLFVLVRHHVVKNRVFFPGAGYLEMGRAAAARITRSQALHGILFLKPLVVKPAGLLVECALVKGHFEVRSASDGVFTNVAVHCSGILAAGDGARRVDHASVRGGVCERACSVGVLYEDFDAMGLQYGPGYRTLASAWSGDDAAGARLRVRSTHEGTTVHPADLDDAQCVGALVGPSGGAETWLPFAVDVAQLQGASGVFWAVRCSLPCKWKRILDCLLSDIIVRALAGCGTR